MSIQGMVQISAVGLFFMVGASFAQASEPAIAVKTDGLPQHVAVKVEQKAAEGVTSLRRYVWITRGMHGLDMRSVVREPTAVVTRDETAPTKLAKKSPAR